MMTSFCVYILPLRNENMFDTLVTKDDEKGLYPTFKEWKLVLRHRGDDERPVYILPLRNENLSIRLKASVLSNVYILPLRNENFQAFPLPRYFWLRVYILPLRNENQEERDNLKKSLDGLYPTFKEWKHNPLDLSKHLSFCLYPTFKEWKHLKRSIIPFLKIQFISYL